MPLAKAENPQFGPLFDVLSDCWRTLIDDCKSGAVKNGEEATAQFQKCFMDDYEKVEKSMNKTKHFFDLELWKETALEIVGEKAEKVIHNKTQVQ